MSQNSPFSTVKLFFVIHKNGYFTGKKCDKNDFSEFLGHFLLHSCYLDNKKKFFFANLNFPLTTQTPVKQNRYPRTITEKHIRYSNIRSTMLEGELCV